MKNMWQKTPAWLKAILYNIIFLFPIALINQSIIQLNLAYLPDFGVGAIAIFGMLYLYWKLAQKWSPFNGENEISISFEFSKIDSRAVVKIIGMMMITLFGITSAALIFNIDQTQQTEYINAFKAFSPLTSIPLLFALAFHAGLVEEVTYRGFMQNTLNRKYSRWITFIITGFLFSTLHFLPWPLFVPYMMVSMAFSHLADQYKSLGVVILAHAMVDFLAFMLMYFNITPQFLEESSILSIVLNVLLTITGFLLILPKRSTTQMNSSIAKAS